MGQIILANLNNKIQLAELIELSDDVNKTKIKTGRNKEQKTAKKNLIYFTGLDVNIPKDFVEFSEKVSSLIDQIDHKKAWEILSDQSYQPLTVLDIIKSLDLSTNSPEFQAAVFLSLNNNKTYFQFKSNEIQIISKTEVSKTIEKIKKEKITNDKKHQLAQILLNGEYHHQLANFDLEIIDNLKSIALYGDKKIKKSGIFDFCENYLGKTQRSEIFELLVTNKIIDKNLPVEVYQSEIPIEFPKKILEISQSILHKKSDEYEDLTDLETFTIDDESTRDRDDAFSLQENYLWIHITDLTNLFNKNSAIDKEAQNRSRSLYLPEFTIPMLPPNISQNVGSINPNEPQQCISLKLEIDNQNQITDWDFKKTLIKSTKALSYNDAELIIEDKTHELNNLLNGLDKICFESRNERVLAGAFSFDRPQVKFSSLDSERDIQVILESNSSKSKMIIAELMIIFNQFAAIFCYTNKIPSIYRTQEIINLPEFTSHNAYSWYKTSQHLRPARISTSPREHSGLGTALYLQATSPLRRFSDLVMQRQIKSEIDSKDTQYDIKEISSIGVYGESLAKNLSRIEESRKKYWFLVYLTQFLNKSSPAIFEGMVLETEGNTLGRLFELQNFPFRFRCEISKSIREGQKITVNLKSVDLWNRTAQFSIKH